MIKSFSSLTALGVRRPILIVVVNILILLAGLAALLGINVRELPDVDRPVVTVRANYAGASPGTMDAEVTSIVEGAVARVAGVKSISSSSEEGNFRMRVEFEPGTDLNIVASDVREAVSRVQRQLPENVDEVQVVKSDADARAIVEISAYSTTLSRLELAERVDRDVAPEFLSIDGVAEVQLEGDQPRVLRVQLDPARMAGFNMSVNELLDTLESVDFDVPAGSYKSGEQELLVRANASITDPEIIEKLQIRPDIRLEDIAEVYYAPEEAESYSLLNGRTVVGLGIVRQAGANTIAISDAVTARMAEINATARDYTLVKTTDESNYIRGALKDVGYTLLFAIGIVLAVIAVFLGQWRAIFIPAATLPISLVGVLAAVWLFGFSINLLTLLALVLATGLIVDDAIVVLENIQRRRREEKMGGMAAAVLGTEQVFFAVIATTLTLVAVFVPIAFLPGETGMLFREFGLVLAFAVIISSFVALTLSPMMASRLPGPEAEGKPGLIRRGLSRIGACLAHTYERSLNVLLRYRVVGLVIALIIGAAGVEGFFWLKQELLPEEDRGQLRIMTSGPDGSSLDYSARKSKEVEAVLQPYADQGYITDIYTVIGQWDPNRTLTTATLSPWEKRDRTQMDLADEIGAKLRAVPGVSVRIWQSNSLNVRGGGAGNGVEVALLGSNYEQIYAAAVPLSRAFQDKVEGVEDVDIEYDTSQPELFFDIDRARASDLKVSLERISETLRVMVDQYDVLDLSVDDQSVPVMVGSARGTINDPGDLLNIYVTSDDNRIIPLASLVTMREQGVAAELDRFEQRRAIMMDVGISPNVPLGDVSAALREVANETLPEGMTMVFRGDAASLAEAQRDTMITFLFALGIVFLVLAAQFESFGSALIVMVTVPFGLAAAVFALLLTGESLNLYSQIGLVMLIGLMTKNAILLVEFMDQLRDEGMAVEDAIREAVRIRLRPVIMTVVSTVLGSLPLVLATGPGAEARQAIGWVIFGGLGLSTIFTLYMAPLGYSLIAPWLKPRAQAGRELDAQLDQARAYAVDAKDERGEATPPRAMETTPA